MTFSAVILAGGKSSRMGRDKAWLEIGGQSLLARQIGIVHEAGAEEVFISGRADMDYSACGCRVLHDKFQHAGPLAGIERALASTTSQLLLALAVDLSEISAEFLVRLATGCSEKRGVIPVSATGIEPLAAFYPKVAHPLAVAGLEGGTLAVKSFAELCVQNELAGFFHIPRSDSPIFNNCNSPSDLPASFRRPNH